MISSENNIVLIAAGGTGGHLYPGIALADELIRHGLTPVFLTKFNDNAKPIFEKEFLRYYEVPVRGMPRKLSFGLVLFFIDLVRSCFYTANIIRSLKPAVVVGMGGFISFPAIFTARLFSIPRVIHEQNSLPGLANRVLALISGRVAVSFASSARFFPKSRTILTGNPVRKSIFSVEPAKVFAELKLDSSRFTVLVFGGSLGASGINRVVSESLSDLAELKDKIQFLHITGKNDAGRARESYQKAGFKALVLEYLHEIGKAYAAADYIICRAGATTVAELLYAEKKSLLVPYPKATGNHQEYNASILVETGLASMIREKDLNGKLVARYIKDALREFDGKREACALPDFLPQQKLAAEIIKIAESAG
ncbi:MAG TPA: undecaprenyldiphospho-muramoylpentapeptide beta-N-acetylglucosaminyltransferase [Elusimicrobia bacterium]|nr:MAG: undecaprenyldiphospho-muramoylpentapeptide beta-N-acetylglucosaminyltransferase [Elusimicrobia bacterium RIFOXYA12_FULL_49_49]OGS09984.1 MAG: undecaprenyldiphospho-muramoylpentapeptide beta-N-acetylglucosaminyltransferase [Elusimicrobia bacterium RIFOXYA1_FULL_47_7]OGS15617.1 MAG: undecaprenyldiphospho-muramoylpentapeptide beta-N-acetylglucosaminyltransferase [Elusimicrobia bacterium RIFOXYA2_FULL_47_53]OGS26828.1 MAG: undecaprenyldiphospho-muramoylpentapeptide beta-N-acetylglucosaminylt